VPEYAEVGRKAKARCAKLGIAMTVRGSREGIERALGGLAREIDDRKEIAWFSDRSSVALIVDGYLKLYFGRRADRTLPLRLVLQREWDGAPRGSELLFDLDGRGWRLPTTREDWMRDEGGGKTWQMVDLPIAVRDPELLGALVGAAEACIRIESEVGNWSWAVPRPQLEAAHRVHLAWRTVTAWERGGK